MMELEQERNFLLRSLEDLDAELAAGEIDEAHYAELRDAYTARAAEVMRELEAGPATELGVHEEEWSAVTGRKRLRRAVAAVTLVVFGAVGVGALVAAMAGERTGSEQVSGSLPGGTAERLARAREYFGQGRALDAIKQYDAILKTDPNNPEALAYRGWLLRLAGLWERGLESIDKAIVADPSYPDARFFKGMILEENKQDPAAAVAEYRAFLAANPTGELATMVERVLERAQKAADQQPPASGPPS